MNPRFLAVFLLVTVASLNAQMTGLSGTVSVGSESAPLSGAVVVVRSARHQSSMTTDEDGVYRFPDLEGGVAYQLEISAAGLSRFQKTDIVLGAGQTRRIDVSLVPANRTESVTVNDSGSDGKATSAEISQFIDSRQLHELPSLNRTVTRFALLDSHVRQTNGLGTDFQDGNRLSINAGSYRNTAYMLDGVSNYDWAYANTPQQSVPLGATAELKVLTGLYSADYGLSTSGILAVTTRSGTNDLHGEAFGFLRPSGIQARPPLSPFVVPSERQDWGVLAGGPLLRDRVWLFGDFERGYQQRGSLIQAPTVSFFNGETFEYTGLFRADARLNANHSLAWRWNGSHYAGNDINDRISGFTQPSAGREARTQSWGSQISEQFTGHNFMNQLRVAFASYFPDSAFPLQPSVSIVRPNYSTTGYSTSNWVHVLSYDAGDTASWTLGRQQIHAGIEFVRQTAHDFSYTPFGTYTFAAGPPSQTQQPVSYSQTFGTQDIHYGQTELNTFVSDEIRVSRRVTATAGLRYEYQSLTNSLLNLAPRLSAAWDIRGNGKTVVHAGTGIFYDQLFMYVTRRFATLGPASPTQSITLPYGAPGFPTFPNSLPTPAAGSSPGKLNLYLPASTLSNPYNLQFSAGIQQQLGRNFTLSLDVQHSHTLKQFRVDDINHPTPILRTAAGQVRSGAAADATRPFSTYLGVPVRDVAVIENSASSLYDALDIGITKRLGSRVQLAGHYVWSSSASYSMFYADANSGIPNEWNNWGSAERAPSDFYQRHRFSGNANVRLPYRINLALVAITASGLPVNPITGTDNNGDTYTVDRPIGFGRNSFRGPAQFNLDAALSRRISLREWLSAELRVESTNVAGRNNYVVVNNVYGQGTQPLATFLSPIAGVTNSDPSRQFRFGVRLLF